MGAEAVEHILLVVRVDPEDRAPVVSAAREGRAVEITLLVHDQDRLRPVAVSVEAVEHILCANRGNLENRAPARRSAKDGRAIEVAICVEDHARFWFRAVSGSLTSEAVEHLLRAGGGQFEHGAMGVNAAPDRRAIKVAGRVED